MDNGIDRNKMSGEEKGVLGMTISIVGGFVVFLLSLLFYYQCKNQIKLEMLKTGADPLKIECLVDQVCHEVLIAGQK